MKIKNILSIILLFVACSQLTAQTPSYDDLTMESDETTDTYRANGKNYVFIRSKRGTSGVNHTSSADSIKSFPVNDIVLVFTELTEEAFDEREDANRERWENLMKTYPEYFQSGTNYKSLCQCKVGGDSVSFKKAQGFYVYYTGKAPAVVKAETPAVTTPVKTETKVEVKTPVAAEVKEEKKVEEKKAVVNEVKEEKKAEVVKEEKSNTKTIEPVIEEKSSSNEATENAVTNTEPEKPKKAPATKARRAKDPKACRPPCYEGGDEDLNAFFKSNISLSKKQKRKSKTLISVVRIQLNHDGTIKKSIITGANELLNKQIEGAVKTMNTWNAAVKGGVAVKSEVKMTLKYDKESKGMKPFETVINPRPGPKCKCASDSEIFGD